MFRSLPLVASLCLLVIGVSAFADATPFTVQDLVAMERVSDPQPSPDGSKVAFGLRTTDLEKNRGSSDLWMAQTDGSGIQQLTSHTAGDFSPRWFSDTLSASCCKTSVTM